MFKITSHSIKTLELLGTSQRSFNTEQDAIDYLKNGKFNNNMWLMPNGYYTDEMFAYTVIKIKEA